MSYIYNLGWCQQVSNYGGTNFDNRKIKYKECLELYIVDKLKEYYKKVKKFPNTVVTGKIFISYHKSVSDFFIQEPYDNKSYYLSTICNNENFIFNYHVTFVDGNNVPYTSNDFSFSDTGDEFILDRYELNLETDMLYVQVMGSPIEIIYDFDWVAWATKEKAKLDNFKKGYDLKFWTTGKRISSSAVILGGTLGFSVNGAKYTLEDIISGTLSKEALGKTFAEGIAKCKGIWLRIGGIIGAILESSIVKTITGVFTTGGLFYVSYSLFTKLMDYTQSLTGSMDDVSYPGWWTQGTTYTEDSTTGSGMAVVPSTNSGAVDNWENYAYTNTDSNGNVGTGATESGTTVNQGNSNLGTVTLATGATVALGIATGTSIPLAVPETTKVGLNILDGQAISLDTTEALASPLPMQPVEWNNNVPPPWMANPIQLHLSDNLANWTVPDINVKPPVIPPVEVPDVNVKVDVNVPTIPNIKIDTPTIPNIKIDTPTSITLDGAITLTPPESIPLTAPVEGVEMIFDTSTMEAIQCISDNIASRNELETTKEEANTVLRDLQIENEQTIIDNKVTNNEILAVEHALYTTKAEGLNYAERDIRAWTNEHSQVEYTPETGITLKKGLKSNPEVNHAVDINQSILTHVTMKGLEGLSDKLAVLRPQENEVEKVIKRFADVNPSMRYDFGGIISKIHIPESGS